MKTNLLVLFLAHISLLGCHKMNLPDISLETEIINIGENSLRIKSSLNTISDKITEHGHCWSGKYDVPNIEFSEFSSLGPLNGVKEFEETLGISINGRLYIRAYVIKDTYIIYGKTETVE